MHQGPLAFGPGIAVADIKNDGWLDIFVTNDYYERDYFYINSHDDGTFKDETAMGLLTAAASVPD